MKPEHTGAGQSARLVPEDEVQPGRLFPAPKAFPDRDGETAAHPPEFPKGGPSLASRVAWAMSGLAVVFVVIFCALAYLVFSRMESGVADAILASHAHRFKEQPSIGRAWSPPWNMAGRDELVDGWLVAGPEDAGVLPEMLRPLGPGLHWLSPDGRAWRVLVETSGQGMLYLRYDATAHRDRVRDFGLIMAALALLAILGAWVLARRLGGFVMRPITDLTERASTWAPGSADLAGATGDEAGLLLEVFNRLQNRVEQSIAFEREFISNLCHEIRTPLAAIRSDSEMALYDPSLTSDVAMRLRRIIANTDAACSGLTSAPVLSGSELSEPMDMSLWQGLEEAWLAFQAEAQKAGLALRNEIPESARLRLAPYAVLVVMRNLIRNAIEHAAPATLTVRCVSDNCLQFSDDGPGIPADVLPLVFARYYSHRLADSSGHSPSAGILVDVRRGLGLAIAKRVCDLHRWRLCVESVNEGVATGTIFTLHFD